MKHTVVVAGLGARGKIHLRGILENPGRYELLGIYDPNPRAVKETVELLGITCPVFGSGEEMLAKTRPEVLVFVTHPEIRMEYIKLGIKHGVKGISFEKPMAVSLSDAREITKLCLDNGIKAVVSHQQKYLAQMQQMYNYVRAGYIGTPELIRIFMRPWASQLGTHFVDYALWANGGIGAEWVIGHVHGRCKLTDDHPSPDYLMGEARLKNGVTLMVESGYLSPFTMPDEDFWCNNRITVYGPYGYAWAETNGACGFFSPETKGRIETCKYTNFWPQCNGIQTPYYKDYADWLDGGARHSCNVEISLHGFELIEGMYKSALRNCRVDLPVQGEELDAIQEMKRILPEQDYPAGFKDGGFYKNGLQVKGGNK